MEKIKQVLASIILIYLRFLSQIQLSKLKPIIVGITGSTGKTSLRNAVNNVLSVKYNVKISEKANSESGIPLDILGLHMVDYSIFDWIRVCVLAPIMLLLNWEAYDVYVVEMGVDSPKSPKNMDYLLKIVKPHVGVLLNVSAVHSEQYDYLVESSITGEKRTQEIIKLIADEKGKLLKNINEKGFAIGNLDDRNVKKILTECNSNIISFGKESGSDVQIIKVEQNKDIFRVDLLIDDKIYSVNLKNTYLPEAYAYLFAAAMAVSVALRVDLDKSAASLEKYQLPPGRMTVFNGVNNSTIIDSSYNSSKLSVKQALCLAETLSEKGRRRVVLALGDMREMGAESRFEHEEIAVHSAKIADEIVLVGPLMKKYFLPKALSLGFEKRKIHLFESSKDAARKLKNKILNEGDVLLVKGSQNKIFMENIVEKLLANPSDKERLCRREKYWDKIRAMY